jgi:hypothetical protein
VFKSVDGGRSWAAVNSGLVDLPAMSLAIDPSDVDSVWVALAHAPVMSGGVYGAGGIYRTSDGGQSWVSANTGIAQIASASSASSTSMVGILRAGDGTLYTADQGLAVQRRYVSSDGGAHWSVAGGAVSRFYPAAATPYVWASSGDGSFVIGGSSDSLIASEDHGASWYDAGSTSVGAGWHGNGFSGLLGTSVAFSPTLPNDLFVTGFDAGNLLRSTDGGQSWTRPLTAWDNYDGGYDVQVGGEGGDVVYEVLGQAGMFNGIAVSRDNGQTFSYDVGGGLPARYSFGGGQGAVAIASADGATAYVVAPNEQVYLTSNFGQSWSQVPVGSPAWAVAVTPDRSQVLIATNAGIEQITRASGAMTLLSGSPAGARQIEIASNGAIYATGPIEGAQSGLWSNQSGTWTRIASNAWASNVAIDPNNSQHVVYVTNDQPYHTTSFATGVWVSCNGGQNFIQDNTGLPVLRVISVTFDPWSANHVIIGTNGRGYWQTQLPPCT